MLVWHLLFLFTYALSGVFKMSVVVDPSSCRICLSTKRPLCPLFRYKLSGNYAEMLTGIADVKVASDDGLPDKICAKCCTCLEKAYLLKTIAERTDKELRKKLEELRQKIPTKKIAFDSLTDIKSEIGPLKVKAEPKWEMEVDLANNETMPNSISDLNDIVIANTVIRKVDPNSSDDSSNIFDDYEKADITWKSVKTSDSTADVEYLDDNFFNDDDEDDEYIPPRNKVKDPIMKNGSRGPPILLKRPKDATILKVHPNFKQKKSGASKTIAARNRKTIRIVKKHRDEMQKQKEKMVCPVCGILTYTLGNHMATHQEKKRYTCTQCPRSFAQRNNLEVHMKQHSGIKDHICEVCGASFYSQKSLIRHNLIHKGDRPFACNLCIKRFIARCDLNRHLRIHSGYKPFKCNTCTMSFNAKHQLQNHERMHTGERPYSCQVCNVAFSYKVNLNNHALKVHDINLKFKSIHTLTEEILQREHELLGNITHLVPPPGAHETVPHYSI